MGRRDTVTGIAIGRDSICCAQCFPEEKLIANVSIQPLRTEIPDFWESVKFSVKELVSNPEVKLSGENIISALPGEYAVIKKVSLDNDENDIDGAIEWEFSQQVIGSKDEFVYDYQKMLGGGNLQHFLVVGYRHEIINRLNSILTSNKMSPIIIDLDMFALINVFELNYKDRLSVPSIICFGDIDKTKLVLTVGGDFIDFEVIENTDVQDPGVYSSLISAGLERIIACNPNFSTGNPVNTYLAGTMFSQQEFLEQTIKKLSNAEILYPFREISCSAGMPENDLRKYSPQLAVAVGLATREID